jgi:hypothetical protein
LQYNDLQVIHGLSANYAQVYPQYGQAKILHAFFIGTGWPARGSGKAHPIIYPAFSTVYTQLIPCLSITFPHACSHLYPHAKIQRNARLK